MGCRQSTQTAPGSSGESLAPILPPLPVRANDRERKSRHSPADSPRIEAEPLVDGDDGGKDEAAGGSVSEVVVAALPSLRNATLNTPTSPTSPSSPSLTPVDRASQLEAELEFMVRLVQLNELTDRAIEEAINKRMPLRHILRTVVGLACHYLGASAAHLRTYNEQLVLSSFSFVYSAPGATATPPHGRFDPEACIPIDPEVADVSVWWPVPVADVYAATMRLGDGELYVDRGETPTGTPLTLLGQVIDVAGESFGMVAFSFSAALVEAEILQAKALLRIWVEELDNHLASIATLRRKHMVSKSMSDALKLPVLSDGLQAATDILLAAVPIANMVLAFTFQGDSLNTLHYKVILSGSLVHDSRTLEPGASQPEAAISPVEYSVHDFFMSHLESLARFDVEPVLAKFRSAFSHSYEAQPVCGEGSAYVGLCIASKVSGDEFGTFDLEVLDRYVDAISTRIVNSSGEWNRLSTWFSVDIVRELLTAPERASLLAPQEAKVAVLTCALANASSLSSTLLATPDALATFVDVWTSGVSDIIWATGGVVATVGSGDLVAVWGPPFFRASPTLSASGALTAALLVRDFAASLGTHPKLAPLLASTGGRPTELAFALHHDLVVAGAFGPAKRYTAFGAAVDHAARLLTLAPPNSVLVTDAFKALLPWPFRHPQFGSVCVSDLLSGSPPASPDASLYYHEVQSRT
ncbi:uncharacterized protein AMSG_00257 [Thecamonas trahens ATCC 50062]|uniref:Guanylate cyclase domain-containing protein n=1 Tax=Thecamonas trahens ATCC 50062 TaxID=461836 RepID=A0A0L0D1A9_THETB|nr:hypothetical protein AMSG_00257 [Thecamonas trahens ATCC 50062]KNC46139.1 hypothetical protein AMSG_00257 [Thecamonas trahens ATCC 50062]|eukprot:XP_013763116.1 hypothetical protein AMSG_00257 [Thecamonas trahens ATCC 50062]